MKTCSAASTYIRRCKLLGPQLPMPEHCVVCESASGDVFRSQSQVPVTGADVVFVVEKSSCMRLGFYCSYFSIVQSHYELLLMKIFHSADSREKITRNCFQTSTVNLIVDRNQETSNMQWLALEVLNNFRILIPSP